MFEIRLGHVPPEQRLVALQGLQEGRSAAAPPLLLAGGRGRGGQGGQGRGAGHAAARDGGVGRGRGRGHPNRPRLGTYFQQSLRKQYHKQINNKDNDKIFVWL